MVDEKIAKKIISIENEIDDIARKSIFISPDLMFARICLITNLREEIYRLQGELLERLQYAW